VEADGRWPSGGDGHGGGGAREGNLQRAEAGEKWPARKFRDGGGVGDGRHRKLGMGGGQHGSKEGVRGPA
jgi:hypothetical protein